MSANHVISLSDKLVPTGGSRERTGTARQRKARMRIVSVTTAVVAYHGQATLVRIDTDEGISGYGEANPDAGADGVVGMIKFLTPLLLGEDPRDVERVWEKLRRRVFAGSQAGVFVIALSGI